MTRRFQPTVAPHSAGKSLGHRRGLLTASTAAFAYCALASASPAIAQGLPTGGTVTAGAATIADAASTVTITQSTQSTAINWQSFSIAAGKSVAFIQPNASAVALNRVLGPDPSVILGNLSANGKVFLINPNGVLFGQGSQVNVGGLVASTLNLSDADFMAGRYRFSGAGAGAVLNQGTIDAAGGYVALLGARVGNDGVIQARLGTVVLAAGEAVTLDVAGDGLLNVAVDTGAVNALVRNGGLIRADGGRVVMTAQAAGQLLHTVVNNSGIVEARTVEGRSGTIVLLGDMQSGTANIAGTLDASAPNGGDGGFIETSAAHVNIANDANVTTLAATGSTGNWLIDPQDFYIAATGGNITGARLSELLTTNSVTITTMPGDEAEIAGAPPVTNLFTSQAGNGDIFVDDAIEWSASSSPTTLTLNAARDINVNAAISATDGNVVLCCGRDANINAAITTVRGSVLVTAGHNVNVAPFGLITTDGVITTTDGNITLCAGLDINIGGAITLTRGTTIPQRSLGLPVGLVMIAGAGGTGPGVAGGTVIFAPLAPQATVVVAPVLVIYNPISYTAPNDYSIEFTRTEGSTLTQRMLVFPTATKVFDGTTGVALAGFNSTALSGLPTGVTLVAGPGATATFDNPAVSASTGVTFAGYTLGGASASQYALAGGTCCVDTFRTTGSITPAAVTPPVITPPGDTPPTTAPGGEGARPSGGTLVTESDTDRTGGTVPAIAAGIELAMIGEGLRMPAEASAQTISFAPNEDLAQAHPIRARPPAPPVPEYAPKQDRH